MADNHILHQSQFGFRKHLSTEHALAHFQNIVTKSFDDHKFSFGVFLDVKKAYDAVHHRLLLYKLEHYGICGIELHLFKTYLENRLYQNYCNEVLSNPAICNTGVVQGGILSPLLFMLFINDLYFIETESNILSYADDTTIVHSNNNMADAVNKLNIDLARISQWSHHNILELNLDKTKCISFSTHQSQISFPANQLFIDNTILTENESAILY